jgi:hypothetical protein
VAVKAEELSQAAQRYRKLAVIRAVRAYHQGHGTLWAVAAAQREAERHERRSDSGE